MTYDCMLPLNGFKSGRLRDNRRTFGQQVLSIHVSKITKYENKRAEDCLNRVRTVNYGLGVMNIDIVD